MRTCDVTGKIQYTNAARAQRVIADAARKARDAGCVAVPQSAYQCLHCDRWHLTHYTPQESRPFHDRDRLVRRMRRAARTPNRRSR